MVCFRGGERNQQSLSFLRIFMSIFNTKYFCLCAGNYISDWNGKDADLHSVKTAESFAFIK